jgi:hypothetical protein
MRVTLRRLFAVAVLAATPALATAAAPAPAAPAKAENSLAAVRKALDEVGDMNYQARSLNDVITDLKEKSKIPVIIDNAIYQFGLDPSQPIVNVNLKQVKLKDGLKKALEPFNLKFGLTAEGLFISTEEAVITRQLRQRVSVDCDGTEFAAAIKQLAADTGANVTIDPRLKDKAKTPVTLKLDDVPLETAVRLLAEVSDLRAVRMSNVLFVTSADKVKEKGLTDDGPTSPSPANPFFPGGFPQPGVIGGIGGFGGAVVLPGMPDPAPANPPPPPPPPVQAPAPAAGGTTPPAPPAPAPIPPPAPPVEKR